MQGDTIIIEPHHIKAAQGVCQYLFETINTITSAGGRYSLTVAGESGSGKSETAAAIAEELSKKGIAAFIFQQDDYFVYPPRSNDRERRKDIHWVGPQEVKIDLLDEHLAAFKDGAPGVTKPLVIYADDAVTEEQIAFGEAQVAIAEGTYCTLLKNVDAHVFIDKNWEQTRAHREKRRRDESELDPFVDQVLIIEHDIISSHKAHAQFIVDDDYSVSTAHF